MLGKSLKKDFDKVAEPHQTAGASSSQFNCQIHDVSGHFSPSKQNNIAP